MAGVLIAAMGLAVAAAGANAEGTKNERPKPGTVKAGVATSPATGSNGQFLEATATCPKGRKAVGGGFTAPSSGPSRLFVNSSLRATPKSWRVTATYTENAKDDPPLALTAYVYCRRVRKVVDITSAPTTLQSGFGQSGRGVTGSAVATCPRNRKLIAGGFEVNPAAGLATYLGPGTALLDTIIVHGNNAQGRRWIATATNFTEPQATTRVLIAHAYCTKQLTRKAPKETTEANLGFNQALTSVSPQCPKKRRMSAGGFFAPAWGMAGGGTLMVFMESRMSDGGWLASAFAYFSGGTFVTAQGICTRGARARE